MRNSRTKAVFEVIVVSLAFALLFMIPLTGASPPVLSDPLPVDGALGISIGDITLSITVNDQDNDLMNVTFASNYKGSWVNYQTNSDVTNGRYDWVFDGAGEPNTEYWWKVFCDDGTENISETYHFTTTYFAGVGSGTAEDPYQITNCDELNQTRDYLGSYFILMNDIDMDACGVANWNGGEGFIPIGNISACFFGSFDGQNYTISNLYINHAVEYQGLFGYVGSGVVKNLGLINVDVTGDGNVGGLIGGNEGIVTDCYSTGTVKGRNNVACLIGINAGGTVTNCYSTGTATGDEDTGDTAGGLIGTNGRGTVTTCYSTGDVTGFKWVGGLAGRSYDNSTITDCYSTGGVTGTTYVGGLTGENSVSEVTDCYSTGYIIGVSSVGGIIGLNDGGIVTHCYWDNETSGQTTSAGGEGRTTEQMTYDYADYDPPCSGLYETWDLANYTGNSSIWVHDADSSQNDGYPIFRWQYVETLVIFNEDPTNGSTGVNLQPTCSVDVVSPSGTMNITWQENSTGSWVTRQTNNSVGDGTYTWVFTQASTASTKYYWGVNCSDGKTWVNQTYNFMTKEVSLVSISINQSSYEFTGTKSLNTVWYTNATNQNYFEITNNGDVAVDLKINATNMTCSYGHSWTLSTSNGPNQYVLDCSSDGSTWDHITLAETTFYTNLGVNGSIILNLRLTMPTSISCGHVMGCTVRISANPH